MSEIEFLALDDIGTLSFTKPLWMEYRGRRITVNGWSELYYQAKKALFEAHDEQYTRAYADKSISKTKYITFASYVGSRRMIMPRKIAEDLYVNCHGSSERLMRYLAEAVRFYREDYQSIRIAYERRGGYAGLPKDDPRPVETRKTLVEDRPPQKQEPLPPVIRNQPAVIPSPSEITPPKKDVAPPQAEKPVHETPPPMQAEKPPVPAPAKDPRVEELMRQVAQLQSFIMRQPAVHAAQEPVVEDHRYHIAAARPDAPSLRLVMDTWSVDTLAFALCFEAMGREGQTGTFQAFLLDKNFRMVSNTADIRIVSGETVNVRFTMISGMSQEKRCYLAIRDKRDVQDELTALIPLDINILFAADFGF